MDKINLQWNPLVLFDKENVQNLDNSINGVYRLSYKHDDGKIYVFYVGEADDIRNNLLNILNSDENQCIKYHINVSQCYFRYAIVETEELRKKVVAQLYKFYQPACNEPVKTNDNNIQINVT